LNAGGVFAVLCRGILPSALHELAMNLHQTILAIDAAWTATQPSGVALVQHRGSGWHCIALAPSYQSFIEEAAETATDWAVSRFREVSRTSLGCSRPQSGWRDGRWTLSPSTCLSRELRSLRGARRTGPFPGNSAAAGAPPIRRPRHARTAGCSDLRRAVCGWVRTGDDGNPIAGRPAVSGGVPASGPVVAAATSTTGAVQGQQVQEILAGRTGAGSNPEPPERVHRHARCAGRGLRRTDAGASGAGHREEASRR
jgi:hypothetical protein